MLHKSQTNKIEIEFKEEQRRLLCSNKVIGRCSSLDFDLKNPLITIDMSIDYLANLIVDSYLANQENEGRMEHE